MWGVNPPFSAGSSLDPRSMALRAAAVRVVTSSLLKIDRVCALAENLGAVQIELTPDDLREIEAAAARIQIQGARLPEAVLKLTGR
ncbi:MAG: hypothetical protein P4L50_29615 [Anaerolineaceae bacterium]|nr:hypothetical protein [Anaerolineaceae bacterium]